MPHWYSKSSYWKSVSNTSPPSPADVERDVRRALAEDLGDGDISAEILSDNQICTATVISRDAAVISGRPWFDCVFNLLDPAVKINWQLDDGETVQAGQTVCTLTGNARALLSGERCALNFLQTLSATASQTRQYVDIIKGSGATILDTRKTLPGLRQAQKYAVRCGGGSNHRLGLYDAYLLKENHIQAAGSIALAVNAARVNHTDLSVEVEVETLDELEQALAAMADRIMLDNFDLQTLRQAVALNNKQAQLEASGGISLQSVRQVAETGVDFISVGAITKDISAIDFSMRFD